MKTLGRSMETFGKQIYPIQVKLNKCDPLSSDVWGAQMRRNGHLPSTATGTDELKSYRRLPTPGFGGTDGGIFVLGKSRRTGLTSMLAY